MNRLACFVMTLLVLVAARPAWAVIVFLKNRPEPIRGFLIQEDAIRVVVNELLPNGEAREQILPRVKIDDIIQAVSAERLSQLDPADPAGYRSYAEDLAIKREDPEARVTALRLYLLAAHLRPHELGRSCLLGMAALARTTAEERACRAVAFLLDSAHDPSLLKAVATASADMPGIPNSDRTALSNALRHLRSGRSDAARGILQRESVRAAAARYAHLLSHEDYEAALSSTGRLSPSLLRKVLALEVALSPAARRSTLEPLAKAAPWSETVARGDTTPAQTLSLETLTEFDPRACVFQDGKWVRPAAE